MLIRTYCFLAIEQELWALLEKTVHVDTDQVGEPPSMSYTQFKHINELTTNAKAK